MTDIARKRSYAEITKEDTGAKPKPATDKLDKKKQKKTQVKKEELAAEVVPERPERPDDAAPEQSYAFDGTLSLCALAI